jgi:hypothetical protein
MGLHSSLEEASAQSSRSGLAGMQEEGEEQQKLKD